MGDSRFFRALSLGGGWKALRLPHARIGGVDHFERMRARVKLHVAMVVKHPHGGLKVHELDWVHSADVLVHGLLLDDELVQLLRSQVLREAELLA